MIIFVGPETLFECADMIIKRFVLQSLSRQFLIANFPIFLAGTLVIGEWVALQVQQGVLNRIGAITGMYVDSFIQRHVQTLSTADNLTNDDRAALQSLLVDTALGKRIVSFKIWRRDGTVLYSTNKSQIGQTFTMSAGLTTALAGNYHSHIIQQPQHGHTAELQQWSRLIETYVPLHGEGSGNVLAVAEFYQTTDALDRQARAAQAKSWMVVAMTLTVIYLVLFGLVRRGSQTIERQQSELNAKVLELTALNDQNAQLHERIRRAAAHTTALNETFLRRISADLHDGPGQDLGLALMQIDSVRQCDRVCAKGRQDNTGAQVDVSMIRASLKSALSDLRAITTGLQMPDITQLSVNEVAARVVRDYETKTTVKVTLSTPADEISAPLPVKITLYRLLQEALANGFRHAGGIAQQIRLSLLQDQMLVEVSDKGVGFNVHKVMDDGHLGLKGMRERVEVLGGTFVLDSVAGQGSTIRICLPLIVPGI